MNSAPNPLPGTRPEGANDERAAAQAVERMFTSIAHRYDLLNHVLSFNVARLWWRRAARAFAPIARRPEARLLDLCCGTGDMAFALHKLRPSGVAIVGADFSRAMLLRAAQKSADRPLCWLEADALRLPFGDASFHLAVSAFGFRNLANYQAGLAEIHRVLVPGGKIGILEFGEPRGLVGALYRLYFRRVLPVLGTLISGVRGPYAYLPASVARFPSPAGMLEQMRAAGFADVSWTPYTFGIAGLYRGTKR